MKWWSTAHSALLNALDAEQWVPRLFVLLTDGRIQATTRDVRQLRDWPDALRESPSWPTLEQHLEADTFLEQWDKAVHGGFCDRAAHHHALLFMNLGQRCAKARDFDQSLRLERWARTSWEQLVTSGYLTEVARDLEADIDPASLAKILRELLQPRVDQQVEELKKLLNQPGADVDEAKLEHLSRWFDIWKGFSSLAHVPANVLDAIGGQQISISLASQISQIDLTTAPDDEIVSAFAAARQRVQALGNPPSAMSELLGRVVTTLWALRRAGRDETPAFTGVVDEGMHIVPELVDAVKRGEALGQNSRCADLYVFRAERERGAARRDFLVKALEISPGHRNASMLLSYVHLHEMRLTLMNLDAKFLPGSAQKTLEQAHAQLVAAEQVFPLNEDLDAHRERFAEACFKRGIDPWSFENG